MSYDQLRPLLFRLDPETAHHLSFAALRAVAGLPGGVELLRGAFGAAPDPSLETRVLGLTFPSPVGLAAGFDKEALGTDALLALGFGFVEAGTITLHAQPGNEKPRMFRLPGDRALLNRLGFNNRGAALAREAFRRRTRRLGIVGANIGKSKITSEEDAALDYAGSTRLLTPYADYVVVNVSSPNTPGLRALQNVEKLEPILRAVQRALIESATEHHLRQVPALLVKIAPDLADEDVDAVADLARSLGLAGIVATNTTLSRRGLRTEGVEGLGAGGISGAPVRARALQVLRRLRARLGSRLTLIGVGGISNADDAWERIRAGASLVQLYTGFVYGGPSTASEIARGLSLRVRAAGFNHIGEAVGTDRSLGA